MRDTETTPVSAAPDDVPGTLGAATRWLATAFREAGIEDAERDARLLVAHAADVDPALIVMEPHNSISAEGAARLHEVKRRRLHREPVARIMGRRGFFGREFRISPATLDPRPDTETVIEAALAIATREGWRNKPVKILDIGTGSGAILATLLAELPFAEGFGTDIDPSALEMAARNAADLGVADRASWRLARSLTGIKGPFDLLVSNPPYIRSGDIAGLAPEVASFDPRTALDGGEDGLDVYREILAGAAEIVPSGWICLEVGIGQARDVAQIAARAGIAGARHPCAVRDLAGIERCVAFRPRL